MDYVQIPYVNKKVSRIVFGAAGPSFLAGNDETELLDAVFDSGVNTFDTARNYQLSEKSLGIWLEKRQNRDKVVILSKCGHPDASGNRVSEACMRADFSKSSELLRTDYIDIYLLHRDDTNVPVGTIVEIFNALHSEGKIGAFGGSNWTHRRIEEANEYAYKHNLIPFSVSSPHFGLAAQVNNPWEGECVSLSTPDSDEAKRWYSENHMPVFAYSSIGRGMLSGQFCSSDPEKAPEIMDAPGIVGYFCKENLLRLKRCEELAELKGCSVPQIAMAWVFSQPINTFAIVRTRSPKRMAENIDALGIKLSVEEADYLNLKIDIFPD